jgi:hypothetical protein
VNDEELRGSLAFPAPEALTKVLGMQEGELYIVKDGELKHLPRSDDDLPKVPVSEPARDALLRYGASVARRWAGSGPTSPW